MYLCMSYIHACMHVCVGGRVSVYVCDCGKGSRGVVFTRVTHHDT